MATFQQRLCAGLEAKGYKRVESGGKYEKFTRSDLRSKSTGKPYYIFVGSAGALRVGPSQTDSRSYGDPSHLTGFYTDVLDLGDKALRDAALVKKGVTDTSALDTF